MWRGHSGRKRWPVSGWLLVVPDFLVGQQLLATLSKHAGPPSSHCCTDLRPELTSPFQKVLVKPPCLLISGTVTDILEGHWLQEHRGRVLKKPEHSLCLQPVRVVVRATLWLWGCSFLSGDFNSLVWGFDYKSVWLKSTPDPRWLVRYSYVFCICYYQTTHPDNAVVDWYTRPLKWGPDGARLTRV